MAGPTEPPEISLPIVLAAAGRRAQRELDAALAVAGLSMRHLGALGHLTRDDNLSVSDLARRSGITPQSMHTTINELERRGALSRDTAGRGRRAAVSVTDEGRRLLTAGMAAVSEVDARMRSQLEHPGTEEVGRLLRFGFDLPAGPAAP
jgi:DNA-binding MarR family transcriptional regulator